MASHRSPCQGGTPLWIADAFCAAINQKGGGTAPSHAPNDRAAFVVDAKHSLRDEPYPDWYTPSVGSATNAQI